MTVSWQQWAAVFFCIREGRSNTAVCLSLADGLVATILLGRAWHRPCSRGWDEAVIPHRKKGGRNIAAPILAFPWCCR